jgi:hypothetical protein
MGGAVMKTLLLIEQQREHLECLLASHLFRLKWRRWVVYVVGTLAVPGGFKRRGLEYEIDRVQALLREVRAT